MPFSLSIGQFPADLVALGAIGAAFVFLSLSGGQRFFVSLLLSLYVAGTVLLALPSLGTYFLHFGAKLPNYTSPIVFLLTVALATWLLAGSSAFAFFRLSRRGMKVWWQAIVASLLATALFAALFFPLVPKSVLKPSLVLLEWFLSAPFPFIWTVLPVLFLAIVRRQDE